MSRLLVALSIRTRLPFSVLVNEHPETIATYFAVLEEVDAEHG